MDKNTLKNGIAGAVIGAGLLTGAGFNPADIDPVTQIKYEEIMENPEQDVYYVVDIANIDNGYFETSHQKIDTARKSLDETKVILKYDVGSVFRGRELGEPFTHQEILMFISNPENGFIREGGID